MLDSFLFTPILRLFHSFSLPVTALAIVTIPNTPHLPILREDLLADGLVDDGDSHVFLTTQKLAILQQPKHSPT
ncbi:hypothetical protein WK95_10250 [Burkholderia ubonensis]|nr:hypothetical protein WK95_10250 [Burkholderia ubonensis]